MVADGRVEVDDEVIGVEIIEAPVLQAAVDADTFILYGLQIIEVAGFQQRAALQGIDNVADNIGVIGVIDLADGVAGADLRGIGSGEMFIFYEGGNENGIVKKTLVLEVALEDCGVV